MRKIRIISQIISVVLFSVLLLFVNRYPLATTIDSDFFLKLNPLTALLTWIASHRILIDVLILSGAVLVVTILSGRLFCGYACPLGACIDLIDMLFAKVRSPGRRPPLYFHRLKYILLAVLSVCAVFGVVIPLFFDPIPILTRIFTFVVDPFFRIVLSDTEHAIGGVFPSAASFFYTTMPVKVPVFIGISLTLVLILAVFGGTFWDKRFWCQYVCPTGAFLGIAGHFSIFRRRVIADKCNSCSACAKLCPVRAISQKDTKKTSVSECIDCGICVQIKEHCSKFAVEKFGKNEHHINPDIHRRHLLAGIAGGALALPVYKATSVERTDVHGRFIRPPGALPEKEFIRQCIACGECMKVCPSNTLQPGMFTDGFNRLYTPKVVPRIAGCEARCAQCGHVCPTGAIRKLTPEDKPYVKIGTAVVDRNRCVAWEQNKECVVCDEICPYNAIDVKEIETTDGLFKVPVVKEDLCMGCGMCEQQCPVIDNAAIIVYRFGENRKAKGPYVTEWQKMSMDENRKLTGQESTSGETGDSHQGGSEGFDESTPNDGFESSPAGEGKLPEGFSD